MVVCKMQNLSAPFTLIHIYVYIYIYYYTEAIDVITAVINTHQVTLLSMSRILFGEQ